MNHWLIIIYSLVFSNQFNDLMTAATIFVLHIFPVFRVETGRFDDIKCRLTSFVILSLMVLSGCPTHWPTDHPTDQRKDRRVHRKVTLPIITSSWSSWSPIEGRFNVVLHLASETTGAGRLVEGLLKLLWSVNLLKWTVGVLLCKVALCLKIIQTIFFLIFRYRYRLTHLDTDD